MSARDIAAGLADRAEEVAEALLGKPSQQSAFDLRFGRRGSLSLRRTGSKRGFYFDHERGEGGDLLTLLARERLCSIGEACAIAEHEFLGGPIESRKTAATRQVGTYPHVMAATEEADRTAVALRIWNASTPLVGSLGETYFTEHRGLDVRQLELNHVLRWHEGICAVVALMTDAATNEPRGVHRTFLNPDGSKRDRRMLGHKGVIRLSPDDAVTIGLGIVEGIEDGLAVILGGWSPVWSAADAGAIARLPILAGLECLTVFADADAAGIEAARACAARWNTAGKEVRLSPPPRAPQ